MKGHLSSKTVWGIVLAVLFQFMDALGVDPVQAIAFADETNKNFNNLATSIFAGWAGYGLRDAQVTGTRLKGLI